MKFNYDTVADAAYLKVSDGKVLKTTEAKDGVVVDIGAKGKIIGIEILNFSMQQDTKKFKQFIKSGLPIEITSGIPATA